VIVGMGHPAGSSFLLQQAIFAIKIKDFPAAGGYFS
jgi:hypothetical protein